jgi:hypothetical protein
LIHDVLAQDCLGMFECGFGQAFSLQARHADPAGVLLDVHQHGKRRRQ